MIKILSKAREQERVKFCTPRNVQDCISIRSIWADGIFQVGHQFSMIGILATVPSSIAFTCYMSHKTHPLYAKRGAVYGEMNGYVEEMVSGQKTILAYAHEKDVCRAFGHINQKAADAYCTADTN